MTLDYRYEAFLFRQQPTKKPTTHNYKHITLFFNKKKTIHPLFIAIKIILL